MLHQLIALCLTCSPAVPAASTAYEAEDQTTSGIVIGPSRTVGTVAAEASGRRAVRLQTAKQFIRLQLATSARGLTIRYSLEASCRERSPRSTAVIEADGHFATVPLIAHNAWDGLAHACTNRPFGRFWEETRVLLPWLIGAGATLSISMAGGRHAKPFAVDVIEAEPVAPPAVAPAGSLSVRLFGADPTGRQSSRLAFIHAIAAARGRHKPLYLPPGHYRVEGRLTVDRLTIVGAGSWYSVVAGHHVRFYARPGGSTDVHLAQFAVESDVWKRQDRLPLAAIGGAFNNSSFDRLYLHNAKVGIWLDGPAHDIRISSVRIADQAADGINLHRGIHSALVENNRIRSVGDDGIASWSDHIANAAILIRGNQIVAPRLANGIAIYGGRNISVIGNRIADVLTEGGGIHLGARFHSAPFSGKIVIADNLIVRSGTMDPHWRFGVGSIWIYALERPINANILLSRNRIEDSGCEAVQLLGPYRIDAVTVNGLQVNGRVTAVFALQTRGFLDVEGVSSNDPPSAPTVEVPPQFSFRYGAGNRGWTARVVSAPALPSCS